MNSKELYARSMKVAPGGVHSPVRAFKGMEEGPLFFKSAKGAKLQSVEGQEFIDFCMSFGPLILGHRDPEVASKVSEMIDTAWTFGACEPYSLELAEWVCGKLNHVDKIRFVSSGTEAVMSALRIARASTKRHKILKFEGCYHGHVDSMLVKAGSGLAGESASDSAGVSEKVAGETLVAPLDDEESVEKIFAEHGEEIAAIIIEPLPANFGLLIQRKEYLQFLADTAKKHGSLLIFDEVISGFRVGLGGMAEELGITPDLVTYGKVLGGGFNVGAYAGKKEHMDLVAPSGPVYQAGTLSANPVGMVAGLATLNAIVERDLYTQLENRTQKFVTDINSEVGNYGYEFSQVGSLIWLHPQTASPIRRSDALPAKMAENYRPLFANLLKESIYFAPSAFEVGFLSWAHSDEVLDQAKNSILKAFKASYA